MILELAHWLPVSAAEGPHERFVIWLQGCSLRCPGCCNPELFERGRGRAVEVDELVEQVLAAARTHAIEGLTVLGGEPLEQLPGLIDLCSRVQRAGLGVIVFTGFELEQARALPGFAALWSAIDSLVDGPFRAREPEPAAEAGGRRVIGSRNQVLHHRSDRYADASLWLASEPTVELRIDPSGRASVHGSPDLARRLIRQLGRDPGLLGAQAGGE
ncbi:4Fe-4S single cluster domain-containing protein [Nannocystaceae bacterium ST9]